MPGVTVAGVCDLSPATAEMTAERHDVPIWRTDHRQLLDEVKPDVVHITTPPASHHRLTSDALDAGAHVIVEKPLTPALDQAIELVELARRRERLLVEDYSYLFSPAVQGILAARDSGELGDVVHVDVTLASDVIAPGGAYLDRNTPHPMLSMPAGAIADYLPHMASIAHAFVGPQRDVHASWTKRWPGEHTFPDELRALIEGRSGTAALTFSAAARPEGFTVRVLGTRMSAMADAFESRLTVYRGEGAPKPLLPLLNGVREARDAGRTAALGLLRRLGGRPASFDGLRELLNRTYRSLADGGEPPLTLDAVAEINALIAALVESRAEA
jgi:predicted dehydrogenase